MTARSRESALAFFSVDDVGMAVNTSQFTVAEEIQTVVGIARTATKPRDILAALHYLTRRLKESARMSQIYGDTNATLTVTDGPDGRNVQLVQSVKFLDKVAAARDRASAMLTNVLTGTKEPEPQALAPTTTPEIIDVPNVSS